MLLLTSFIGKSQRTTDFNLLIYTGGGVDYYTGDLKDNILPELDYLKPFGTIGVDLRFRNIFHIGLGYFQGNVIGADRLGNNNPTRNFEFKSYIKDYHLLAKINLFNFRGRRAFTPGILFGAGLFNFDPQIYANEKWVRAQPLGSEGQNLGGSYPSPYQLTSTNIKIGIEFTYRLSCRWFLDVYTFFNKTQTDYLDDVSGLYPNYEALLASENGATIVNYTYTYDNGFIPPANTNRGNPNFKDGYWNIGININYQLTGSCRKNPGPRQWKKRKALCPAY